jgi:hypothetical protein
VAGHYRSSPASHKGTGIRHDFVVDESCGCSLVSTSCDGKLVMANLSNSCLASYNLLAYHLRFVASIPAVLLCKIKELACRWIYL